MFQRSGKLHPLKDMLGKILHHGDYSIMPIQNESPFTAYLFVCTNDRGGERKSCVAGKNPLEALF
jgi:hypothetical protein